MGKLSAQPELTIHHFSHPHPLKLSHHQPQQLQTPSSATCSCCKLKVSGWIYICTNSACNYILHIPCSNMPQHITHPFDQSHTLSLYPKPTYPQGFYNCDACGKQGNGFSYHCGICNIDLHTFCSTMPLSLTHQSHHHPLNLTFSPPYHNKGFSCDICKNMGSKEWLYRCNLCEFDAHLVCATAKPRTPVQQVHEVPHYQPPTPTQYAEAPILQNGPPINYILNTDTRGVPGPVTVRTQQNAISDRQVFQFLLNATLPGIGLLMQGQQGSSGVTNYSGESGAVGDGNLLSSLNGDFSGMDLGGFAGF